MLGGIDYYLNFIQCYIYYKSQFETSGDWGLGIGGWAQSPIPNPQSPIPNIYDKVE